MAEFDRMMIVESTSHDENGGFLRLFPWLPGHWGPDRTSGKRYPGVIKRPDGSEKLCEFELHYWEFMVQLNAPPGSDHQLNVVLPGCTAEDVPVGSELWTSDEECLLTIAWADP